MRLSAAAVVAIGVGVSVFLSLPGTGGTTWADVVKATGPVETVRYRTHQPGVQARSDQVQPAPRGTERVHYETARGLSRVDSWAAGDPLDPATQPSAKRPETSTISRERGGENETYEITWRPEGPARAIRQSVAYVSPTLRSADYGGEGAATVSEPMAEWRALLDLPPEAVVKRGYEELDKRRVLKFEVVAPPEALAGQFPAGTAIWVDPGSKRPVSIETPAQMFGGGMGMGGGFGPQATRWSDIHINETFADDLFAAPAVPEDIDAEVFWHFQLPIEAWDNGVLKFRVLGPKKEEIVTEADLHGRQHAPSSGGEMMMEDELGMEAQRPPAYAEASLSQAGIDKLDRFMARNPGAEMTIEIAGEPPIRRTVYGRLVRGPQNAAAVLFRGQGKPMPPRATGEEGMDPSMPGRPGMGRPYRGGQAPAVPGGFQPPPAGRRPDRSR